MDDPADDRPNSDPPGEHAHSDGRRVVRRTRITVEREITTIILRRKKDSAEDTRTSAAQTGEDRGDGSSETP